MQEPDRELEDWRREWQADRSAPVDLRKMVEAGTRHMRRGRVGEVAITIVMGGGGLVWAVSSQTPESIVLAIGIWVLFAFAWTASLLLTRGAWEPASSSTAAFLEISILRTERRLQATVIQAVLYVVISVFDFVWLYYYLEVSDLWTFLSRPASLVFLFVVTPAFAGFLAWYRRRLHQEMKSLTALRSGRARRKP